LRFERNVLRMWLTLNRKHAQNAIAPIAFDEQEGMGDLWSRISL
jgi:hypothetical protein